VLVGDDPGDAINWVPTGAAKGPVGVTRACDDNGGAVGVISGDKTGEVGSKGVVSHGEACIVYERLKLPVICIFKALLIATAIDAALGNRSAGSLARLHRITSSRAGGTIEFIEEGKGGGVLICCFKIA